MNTFYSKDRSEWRGWLSEHFKSETEVWFIFPQKGSGEESMLYNDAVEEALCFGWIDSTIKHIDPLHRAQRFTPRRPGSRYSQPNIERLKWLESMGMIHPDVRDNLLPVINSEFVFPGDIINAIKADELAWENYQKFSDSYRRIRIAYIEAARKRPEEFEKRLGNFIEKTRNNRLIRGFGGIEKYYH